MQGPYAYCVQWRNWDLFLGVSGPSLVCFPTLSLLMDVHCSVPKKDDQRRKINKVMSSFDKMGFNAT